MLVVVGFVLLAVSFVPALRSLGNRDRRLKSGQMVTIVLGLVCVFTGFWV